ncbi:MAG: CxxC-x17-CxxC domain-containing protein [Candidatus Sericytochromatia bacterium]
MSQVIVCADCATEFTFSSEEQAFFAEKGFSTPRRCKPCRAAAKAARGGGSSGGGSYGGGYGGQRQERQMYDVTCDQCGVATQVPFKPNGAKPVLCRECFRR